MSPPCPRASAARAAAAARGGDVGVTNAGSIQTQGRRRVRCLRAEHRRWRRQRRLQCRRLDLKPNTATGSATGGKSFSLAVGGSGGNGDIGGAVKVTNSGSIQTAGDGSYAILAHSIGGGGWRMAASRPPGSGGASSNQEGATSANIALSLGGNGGVGNRGGDVTVSNAGDILTQGADRPRHLRLQRRWGRRQRRGGTVLRRRTGRGQQGPQASTQRFLSAATGGDGDGGGAVVVGNSASIATNGNVADAVFCAKHRRRRR
ncbi:MAG: hypothetical protein WDM77_22005 [Steroidobacteraceae bacterium]